MPGTLAARSVSFGPTSLQRRGIGFDGWRQLLLIWSLEKDADDPGEKPAMSTIAK